MAHLSFSTGNIFWANLVQKINRQFSLKLGLSLVRIWMKMFTFPVFHQKYSCWASLYHKIKIVSLSWNLVPKLIWICRSQWWGSLFLLSTVWTSLIQKDKIVSLSWNLVPRIIRVWRIQWWPSCLSENNVFGQILSQISRLIV